MIGGALARPVDAFPSIFARGSIWDQYPYLLPNLFSAICVFCGLAIGLLFLEETHSEKKHCRDRGVELGNYLLSLISRPVSKEDLARQLEEEEPLLTDGEEQLPGYRSTEQSPRLASTPGPKIRNASLDLEGGHKPAQLAEADRRPATTIFTRQVILIIISYGILAL
jgi:hypothetical protein